MKHRMDEARKQTALIAASCQSLTPLRWAEKIVRKQICARRIDSSSEF